jgi:sugar lactone lactonase YvrE
MNTAKGAVVMSMNLARDPVPDGRVPREFWPSTVGRTVTLLTLVLSLAVLTAMPTAARPVFPEVVQLPTGMAPEGIAVGTGTEVFAGSLLTGRIYKGDLRTGAGGYLHDAEAFDPGRSAVGMAHDQRSDALFVAGGILGQAYVYDADTGDTLAVLQLTTSQPTFVNDVILTADAAYFTDSFQPVMYRVPLTAAGLPTGAVDVLPLTGDFVFTGVPGEVNANGIEATSDGSTLLVVNMATGLLYTVDPTTGVATEVNLGGDSVVFGDGILRIGRTLYVVQNFLNTISAWQLSPDLSSANRIQTITSPEFKIPTTAARHGNGIYVVNGRFDIVYPGEPADGIDFQIVRVDR